MGYVVIDRFRLETQFLSNVSMTRPLYNDTAFLAVRLSVRRRY